MKRKAKTESTMTKVRVLQGCSILVAGIWHNQGTVLEVADPSVFTKTITDDKGNPHVAPCVERAESEAVNIPEGILPEIIAPPAPLKQEEE